MYNRLSPKQEAENAYKRGVEDATNGRERKNASGGVSGGAGGTGGLTKPSRLLR